MKRTDKYLIFQQMKLELEQAHPKDVSRAIMCLKDTENDQVYKTEKYGEVQPETIQWPEDKVEILYTDQQMIRFETVCQHQYGYKIQELEALYHGQIYIKTENFFRGMVVHVFDQNGQKCGILRYMIKILEREANSTAKNTAEIKEQEPIKVNLMGKVNIYAASVNITSISFKKQKYINDLTLKINICGQQLQGFYKKNYTWNFTTPKVQHTDLSPEQITISLTQGDIQILNSETTITHIQQNKRFVTQAFPLYDHNEHKVGTITIDLRYVTKQQLLDLLYSPTKLAAKGEANGLKNQKNVNSHNQLSSPNKKMSRNSRVNSSLLESKAMKKSSQLRSAMNNSRIDIQSPQARQSDRYKRINLISDHHELIISRAKRFNDNISSNPNVSYSDPSKLSDFKPYHGRGASFCTSKKLDFTKNYKHIPGVGSYKLPSIWDRY